MRRIIISYRRSDSQYATDAIYAQLVAHFGDEQVFMDIDNIPLGVNFLDYLHEQLDNVDVVLPVIGSNWINTLDDKGNRRLDNPDDFVRVEIESALKRGALVIPIYLQGLQGVPLEELPESLHELHYLNAKFVRRGADFERDVQGLIKGIEAYFLEISLAEAKKNLPETEVSDASPTLPSKIKLPNWLWGVQGAIVLGAIILGTLSLSTLKAFFLKAPSTQEPESLISTTATHQIGTETVSTVTPTASSMSLPDIEEWILGDILFEDNMENGTHQWFSHPVNDKIYINQDESGNHYLVSPPENFAQYAPITDTHDSWGNYQVEFNFFLKEPTSEGYYHIRLDTKTHSCGLGGAGYNLHIVSDGISLEILDNCVGFYNDDFISRVPIAPDEWHHALIVHTINLYQVFIDNEEVLKIEAPIAYEFGQVNFSKETDEEFWVDNITIIELVPEE